MKKLKLIILIVTFFSFANKFEAITNITLSEGSLVPNFNASTHVYNVFLSEIVSEINISATLEETDEYVSGIGKLILNDNLNKIILEVNKYDKTVETYTLNIYKGYKNEYNDSDSSLNALIIENKLINFDKETLEYDITIPNNQEFLKVEYQTTNPDATVIMEGNSPLNNSNNKITLTVTSKDKQSTTKYTINALKTEFVFEEETKKEETSIFGNRKLTKKETIIIIIIISLIVLLLIVLSYIILFKKKGINKK